MCSSQELVSSVYQDSALGRGKTSGLIRAFFNDASAALSFSNSGPNCFG